MKNSPGKTTLTRSAILSRLRRDSQSCSTGFKFFKKEEIQKIPTTAGVYAFLKNREFLYIGKAANLKERIKNHFRQPAYRDGLFLEKTSKIGYIETGSEIDALLLEAKLIKKYQPKYNVIWKDDKNYFYVAITKEEFPRIFITHQPKYLKSNISNLKSLFIGPFVEGSALKQTLRILRKIFPYYSAKKHPKGLCPWCHLGQCPGPKADKPAYQKDIKSLIAVLKGKRGLVLLELKREMKNAARSRHYEKAAKIRDQIAALERIMSQAKVFDGDENKYSAVKEWGETEKELKKILGSKEKISKIEAYDVSNIQGNFAAGSMITFINGRPNKNFYRKFKIKAAPKPNDIAMLKEVLARRFKHAEWPYPDLILIDGGRAQLNAALHCLTYDVKQAKKINVVAVAKRNNEMFIENRKKPLLLKNLPRKIFNLILQLRDEAHRFAISYHKKLRTKYLIK